MKSIHVKDATIRFGGLIAVDKVSFSTTSEMITGLIGPNGAGKSTILNAISGFQTLSSGQIELDGVRLDKLSPDRIACLGLVRTFQAGRLFANLTVRDNIIAGAFASGKSAGEAAAVLEDIAEKLEISHLLTNNPAGALPYTDQRRVTIARALALSPKLLCLDEPAAGMSDGEILHFMQIISQIPKMFGCGVLLVEHNMELVMGVCDKIIVVDSGIKIAEGKPVEVQNNQTVINSYLG